MSNNFGLISGASLHESAEFTLDEATSTAQRYLSAIAKRCCVSEATLKESALIALSEDFVTKVAIAFGDNFDADSGLLLRFASTLVTYFNNMFF